MYYLKNWQKRWGIPDQAMLELNALYGTTAHVPKIGETGESESIVQQKVRFEASQQGIKLWRNNVGAYQDDRGGFVRYGLANESKKMNTILKSSDLIGITPVNIGGTTLGIFTSYEVKKAGWKWSGNKHELAQQKWLELVVSMGGIGKFVC